MKYLKLFAVAIPLWFVIGFGLAWTAEILRIPDTDIWMWILRVFAAIIAVFIAWIVTGVTHAQAIARSVMAVISTISYLLFAICIVFGVAAVLMIFIKDYTWVNEYIYQPFIARALGVCIVSVIPLALMLLTFHRTRALGGISLYLLSYFFGFSLWLYTLIYAASSGLGWVIGGLIIAGIGIVPMAIISAVVHGQWTVAGAVLLTVIIIWFARITGWAVAAKQLEKEEDETITVAAARNLSNQGQLQVTSRDNVLSILCVDDDELTLEVIAEELHEAFKGTRIDVARDGEEALNKCLEHMPTLMITGVAMPGMNGIELIKSLRARNIYIPVLVYSGGYSSDDLKQNGIQLGKGVWYLKKSGDLRELIHLVNSLLESIPVDKTSLGT